MSNSTSGKDKYFYIAVSIAAAGYFLMMTATVYFNFQEKMEKLRHAPAVTDTTSTPSRP